ncbi:MAG: hypothetical protein AB7K09_04880 [Planctomycetota bacterium]
MSFLRHTLSTQSEGSEAATCADIFALGVTWYWLVNKRYPISGEHVQDTMEKILADPPVSLSRYCGVISRGGE